MKEDIQFNENDVFLCKTNEQFFVKTWLIVQRRENILMNKN